MDDRKPVAPLIGANGNIFNLLSIASNSLIASNKPNDALEMWNRVTNSKSYNEALRIIEDYVEFGESEEQDNDNQAVFKGFEYGGLMKFNQQDNLDIDDTEGQDHCRQGEFNSSKEDRIVGTDSSDDSEQDDAVVIYGLNTSNQAITKVDFTQELHITNNDIVEIMKRFIEESTINWYESISSSPTSIEKVETNLISNGGTVFFRIQGEDYNRTFDGHDLIYGLLRVLPDCLYVINGNKIDTLLLDYDNIDHLVQYGLFGEIEY